MISSASRNTRESVESWREIGPPDPTGVMSIGGVFLSGDGLAYVYSYNRVPFDQIENVEERKPFAFVKSDSIR